MAVLLTLRVKFRVASEMKLTYPEFVVEMDIHDCEFN